MNPTMSVGYCDCGATIGKTLIEGRWYWTHGGAVGAAVDHMNGAGAVGSGVQQAGTATDRTAVAATEDTDSPSSPPRPTTHTNGSTNG